MVYYESLKLIISYQFNGIIIIKLFNVSQNKIRLLVWYCKKFTIKITSWEENTKIKASNKSSKFKYDLARCK
jgi:hypothetical protein